MYEEARILYQQPRIERAVDAGLQSPGIDRRQTLIVLRTVAVIGAGPAGLMAAEVLAQAGIESTCTSACLRSVASS